MLEAIKANPQAYSEVFTNFGYFDSDSVTKLKSILKDNHKEQHVNDLNIIVQMLCKSKLYEKLRLDNYSYESIEKIIMSIAHFMRFKKVKEYEYVFYQGDQSDKYFIVIQGQLEVLIDEISIVPCLPKSYVENLIFLKRVGEHQLANKIARMNKDTYSFDQKHLDNLEYFVNYINYRNILLNLSSLVKHTIPTSVEYAKALRQIQIDYKTYNFSSLTSNSWLIGEILVHQFLSLIPSDRGAGNEDFDQKQLLSVVSEELEKLPFPFIEMQDFSKFYFHQNTENVYAIKRKMVKELISWDFFGEMGLDSFKNRSASIKATSDCILASITAEVYKEFLAMESRKITSKNVQFLLDKYFFCNVPRMIFLIKYYPYFLKKVVDKGKVLFEEGDKTDKVYFVISGRIDISLKKSILSLNSYISQMVEKLQGLVSKKGIEESIKSKLVDILAKEEAYQFSFTKNYKATFNRSQIKEVKDLKISTIESVSVLGLEEFFLECDLLKKCVVSSKEVVLFELNKSILSKLIKDEQCTSNFSSFVIKKLIYFMSQMQILRNNCFDRERNKAHKLSRVALETSSKTEVSIDGLNIHSVQRNDMKIASSMINKNNKFDLANYLNTEPDKTKSINEDAFDTIAQETKKCKKAIVLNMKGMNNKHMMNSPINVESHILSKLHKISKGLKLGISAHHRYHNSISTINDTNSNVPINCLVINPNGLSSTKIVNTKLAACKTIDKSERQILYKRHISINVIKKSINHSRSESKDKDMKSGRFTHLPRINDKRK